MEIRSKESYTRFIYEFSNEMYVVCHKCNKQAFLRFPADSFANNVELEIKLVCPHCGLNKIKKGQSWNILFSSVATPAFGNHKNLNSELDPFFQISFWLSTNCCNSVLWAYNYEHLSFIKGHVEAKLRERNGNEVRNKSLGSRLPKWMTSAKNRESVLLAIEHLQSKN